MVNDLKLNLMLHPVSPGMNVPTSRRHAKRITFPRLERLYTCGDFLPFLGLSAILLAVLVSLTPCWAHSHRYDDVSCSLQL